MDKLIKNMRIILCQNSTTFVPNFIILSQVVAEKSLTKDVHMHYIGMRDK